MYDAEIANLDVVAGGPVVPITIFENLFRIEDRSLRRRSHVVSLSMSKATNKTNNASETMTDKIEIQDCPKCSGRGVIEAFAHYADGVCFCCKGAKKISVNITKLIAQVGPERRKKAEFILAATAETFETSFWTYAKLEAARTFCHGGWGLGEAYPELHAHWFATGEAAFQAAQEVKLAEFYAANPV